MAKVIGTHGKIVDFQVFGVATVMARIKKTGMDIKDGADLGVVQAGAFIEDEVKESIAGRRAEARNVDTGQLINSIEFNKTGDAQGIIKPRSESYPGGANTQEVATILEYGSQGRQSQPHFRNTEKRNKDKVKEKIEEVIKRRIL